MDEMDALIKTIAEGYTAAAKAALDPSPSRVLTLAPGAEFPWDPTCGTLYTRISNLEAIYPQNAVGVCDPSFYLVEAYIGVLRCAAPMTSKGNAPPVRKIEEDAWEMLADMNKLRNVLRGIEHTRRLGLWLPLGPEGGLHGGEWGFTFRVGLS